MTGDTQGTESHVFIESHSIGDPTTFWTQGIQFNIFSPRGEISPAGNLFFMSIGVLFEHPGPPRTVKGVVDFHHFTRAVGSITSLLSPYQYTLAFCRIV
jgi:hypothetical protein